MDFASSYHRTIKRFLSSLTYSSSVPIIAQLRQQLGNGSSMNRDISKKQITAMLRAWSDGKDEASEDLIRAVYSELQKRARYQLRRERPGHTLETSALINEAYMRLIDQRSVKWQSREQFFALAARLMRR